MIFLIVNTNSDDLLLGLDFLMKIRVVIDVEKGVIQVHNGPGTTMEVLHFNVVNMLHMISKLETSRHDQMRKGFNKMSLDNGVHMKYLHGIPHQPFLILPIVLMIPFLKET